MELKKRKEIKLINLKRIYNIRHVIVIPPHT